eukprot:scaffold3479_cov106-Cylindrotheca_fusiformis.AAC.4
MSMEGRRPDASNQNNVERTKIAPGITTSSQNGNSLAMTVTYPPDNSTTLPSWGNDRLTFA